MTKKDRWLCKTFIDWILSDVEKRDRDIVELWNQLTDEHKSVIRKLADLRDRKDYEIWVLKNKLWEMTALKLKAEWRSKFKEWVTKISLIINIVLILFLIF